MLYKTYFEFGGDLCPGHSLSGSFVGLGKQGKAWNHKQNGSTYCLLRSNFIYNFDLVIHKMVSKGYHKREVWSYVWVSRNNMVATHMTKDALQLELCGLLGNHQNLNMVPLIPKPHGRVKQIRTKMSS